MTTSLPPEVLPVTLARAKLNETLRRFRGNGALAEPVVLGSHRKPEAAVIPFALYETLLPVIEDLEIAQLVRDRAAGESVPLADVAAVVGLDPESYR